MNTRLTNDTTTTTAVTIHGSERFVNGRLARFSFVGTKSNSNPPEERHADIAAEGYTRQLSACNQAQNAAEKLHAPWDRMFHNCQDARRGGRGPSVIASDGR